MSTESRTIVLASRNLDKLRELRQICSGLPFQVTSSLDYPGLPEVIEDGTTVLGNATRKAIVTAAFTGEIAIADDTSFQLRALGGMPDIFASRFAGPQATYDDNAQLALALMDGVPDDAREARFETSMVWVDPAPPAGLPAAIAGAGRWLHDPWALGRALPPGQDADTFWNTLGDRRRCWEDYAARVRSLPVAWGADRTRLLEIVDRLLAPLIAGRRPTDAPADAVRLPDTRIWTVTGPSDREAPLTAVAPAGLPADAPGRGAGKPIWLELAATGRLLGRLGRQPVGTGGFGYDPVFEPVGLDLTLAEIDPAHKNAISHRGKALTRLLGNVRRIYGF